MKCLSSTSHTHTTLNHHSCSNIFILYVTCSSFFILTHSTSLFWFTTFIHYYYFQFTPCSNATTKFVLFMIFFHFLLHLHKCFLFMFKVGTKTMKVMALIIEDFFKSNFWLKMCGMVMSFYIISTYLMILICWWQRKLKIGSRLRILFHIWTYDSIQEFKMGKTFLNH